MRKQNKKCQSSSAREYGQKKRGFTLIEILVVIGIIAILAAVVLVAINPSRQFKLARDSQRISNVNSILNAVSQNMAEHSGVFTCDASSTAYIPSTAGIIADSSHADQLPVDIADCLVPDYIAALPFDPSVGHGYYTDPTDYDTEYQISEDAIGRITVSAFGEINKHITVTR